MATPTSDQFKTYFPSRSIAADGDPLAAHTIATATARTLIDTTLISSTESWNGALGWFDGDTATAKLRACFFHVRAFDSITGVLTLSRDLPAVPQAGDTFRLVLGGSRRSSQETFGLMAAGKLPELQPVTLSSITGVTLTKVSGMLGEGDITLHYDATAKELYLKKSGESFGVGLNIAANLTSGIVFAADGQSYLRINVTAAGLPSANTDEVLTLTTPEAVFTPDFEGYETANGFGGKVRYRLEILRNEDAADTMVDLAVYTSKPAGAVTTIASSPSLTPAEGEFTIANASKWPTHSFWVKNTTRNDCRYIRYRSGTTLYTMGAGSGLRGFSAVNWETNDALEIMSDVDIAAEMPDANNVFSNPADETTAPAGLTFADHGSANNALYIGDLAPGKTAGIWRRETILDNHRARKQIESDTITFWS